PGDALQVAGLLVGKADLDGAVVAVALDLVDALVRAAAGCETHVVLALDAERRRQGDRQQHRLRRPFAARAFQPGRALAELGRAVNREAGDLDPGAGVGLHGHIERVLTGAERHRRGRHA